MMEFPALAGNVTLSWNASTDPTVAGYNIYFWISGSVSTNQISVGDATGATISNLVAGATYSFAATTYNSSGVQSPFSTEVSFTVPTNVVNQLAALNPISNLVIVQSATATQQGNNTVSQTAPQTVALTGISSSTANQQQTLTITATSSNPALVPNPSVHYTSPGTTGTLTFTPAANATGTATITVILNNNGKGAATNTFTVTVLAAGTTWPMFTSQLTNKLVVAGQPVNFGISANGTGPLKYQWIFDGANLAAATNATLTLNGVTTNQAGTYSVMVSNIAGATNSNPATLTVYATAAANVTPAVPGGGQFGLTIAGVPGYHYVVQASTDLVNWVSIQTNTAPFTFVDPKAGQFSQRFYRSIFNP